MSDDINVNNQTQRRPKKLIHCSDGVIEESESDDEVDRAPETKKGDSLVEV